VERDAAGGMGRFPLEGEAQPSHDRTGGRIVGFVDAHDPVQTQLLEPIADPGGACLGRVPTTAIPVPEPPTHIDYREDLRRNVGIDRPTDPASSPVSPTTTADTAIPGSEYRWTVGSRMAAVSSLDQPRRNG
jgi:hypothetical protein